MTDSEKDQLTELWINQIGNFVCNLDIDDSLKEMVKNTLISQKELIREGMVTDEIFGTMEYRTKTIDKLSNESLSFINYLNNLLDSKGLDFFETAIKYSLDSSSNLSFIDNFMRFITITNYNDIEIVDTIDTEYLYKNINEYDSGSGFIRAYLGGFMLCDLSQFSAHQNDDGEKFLDFYNFHSRKNMTRTKVGTLLIRHLLQRMLEDNMLQDYSLGSVWVMRNNQLAKNFYEKLGFKFIGPTGEIVDYHYYDDYIKVKREDYPNLSDMEFYSLKKKMGGNFEILIPSEEKQMILDREVDYPYIEYDGQIYDCTSSFKKSREM